MVNASLNWASIVGIVLAVCGGGLYFLRSFKPALARDYDVFFAALGLLCGGILFFQGWRLDPILQFGQFLLAGTTVFFAYESVRLRGVATDQARRSSFFEEDDLSEIPRNSRNRFEDEYDKFENSERLSRRFKPQEDDYEDDYREGRPRRRTTSRAIPASAVSRRRQSSREFNQFDNEQPRRRRPRPQERIDNDSISNNFGDRRNASRNEIKRGSRPKANQDVPRQGKSSSSSASNSFSERSVRSAVRTQTKSKVVDDASFKNIDEVKSNRQVRNPSSTKMSSPKNQSGRYTVGTKKSKPRDNSSRFDD